MVAPSFVIRKGDSDYPVGLLASGPQAISGHGDASILHSSRQVALVSSIKCPGGLILKTYDAARALRDAGIAVIAGFHSPMEKEALDLLLRGRQQVIVCPAKSLSSLRMPAKWREPLKEGRLLVLSFFETGKDHTNAANAALRNEYVAACADCVLVVHAGAGSKTEALARKVVASGKPLLCLEDEKNTVLTTLGARAVPVNSVAEVVEGILRS